jgi:putative ABC transport system permease protein
MTSVIINEAMLNDFGWTLDNAVGQQLKGYSERLTPIVIGVVKNFHFRPFSEKVEPQMFHEFHDYSSYKYFVKMRPGDPTVALTTIKKAWSSAVPDLPLKYDFVDESLDRFYKSETRWSNIVGWAGGISIFLACLGLFGLAALAAVNRTKEIGIRKVLGASVPNIVGLLSKDFGDDRIACCHTDCLVFHAQMVAGFCLPDQYQLDRFCCYRNFWIDHRLIHGWSASGKSGCSQSCQEPSH